MQEDSPPLSKTLFATVKYLFKCLRIVAQTFVQISRNFMAEWV